MMELLEPMNFLNSKKIVLCLLIISGISYSQTDSVHLSIRTNSDSTALFFDNEFYGVSKNFNLSVGQGTHSIYLVENIRLWDAEIIKDTILAEESGQMNFEYQFKEKILINTTPQDVYIYEKDSLMGFTPTFIESGFNELKLYKPDYQSINVNLSEVSNGKKPELDFTGEAPKRPFFGSTLFTVLLGTAIALGAATAYYKLKADDLYEEYLITGDAGLLDNIDQYDGQSAGTLIAMEICVGTIIYFFLSE